MVHSDNGLRALHEKLNRLQDELLTVNPHRSMTDILKDIDETEAAIAEREVQDEAG